MHRCICSAMIALFFFTFCSIPNGLSNTLGRCLRPCLTCCALGSVDIHRRAQLTHGWPWSVCWPEPPATHCSLAIRRRSYSHSILQRDFTTKRWNTCSCLRPSVVCLSNPPFVSTSAVRLFVRSKSIHSPVDLFILAFILLCNHTLVH